MEAYFIIANIEGGSKKFKLNEGEYVIIGRSPNLSQVQLDDSQCSSKHCKITMNNNTVYVEDLDSKNGIYLNGVRVIKQTLYIGDKLKIGNNLMYIHEGKLGDLDRAHLTYEGGSSRKSRDLTLEVDTPNLIHRDLGPKGTSEPKLPGRNRDLSEHFNKNRNVSKTRMALFEILAFLIDMSISLILFILCIKLFAIIFSEEYESLAKNNSLLKIMISEEMGLYTFIICIVSIGFFTINRSRKKGSIGERILKVN